MTQPKISEAAIDKRLNLARQVMDEDDRKDVYVATCIAFDRFIQTTSDVAKEAMSYAKNPIRTNMPLADCLQPLILPDDPDPLEEVLEAAGVCRGQRAEIAAALHSRGLQITPIAGGER